MKNQMLSFGLVASLLISVSGPAQAFTFLMGHKAPVEGGHIEFSVNIPGVAESGISWNSAFQVAANQWSMTTPVTVSVTNQTASPCQSFNGISGAGFSDTLCGEIGKAYISQGASALASTHVLDGGGIGEVDIVFNSSLMWNVYDGITRVVEKPSLDGQIRREAVLDFRRTSLHEIGHGLGLGHSMFPGSALTNAAKQIFDRDKLTADDICGVSIANGRPDMCPLILTNSVTMTGKTTSALFVAGASSDRGRTFTNTLSHLDTLDLMATVVVEDEHYGLPGRVLTVIELSDGSALMKTDNGFAPWDGSVQALRSTSVITLSGANEIYILEDFNLEQNGIRDVGVAVYIGYSLDAEPDEVYYSGAPLQFRVN